MTISKLKTKSIISALGLFLVAGLALGLKLSTGQSLTTSELFSPDHQTFHVQLSPDGTKSLVRRAIDGTRRIDVFEFAEDRFLDIHRENFTSAHWRLDSNSIYASTRKNLYVYDLVNRVSGQHSISPTNLKQWRVVRYPQTESQSLLVAARSSNRSRQRDIHRCSDLLGAAPRCETVVEGLPPHGVVVWDQGDNVVGRSAADDGGNIHWAYRSGGSGWLPAFHYPSDRILTPLSPIDLNGEFLALSDRGRNFAAMVNVNLSTGEERVVYADPQKSLRWVYMSRDNRRPLVAKTSDPFGKFYYFDTAPKALFERLRARYANPVWINIVDIDRRENRWLVTVQGLTLPQELFLLDVERDQIQQLAAASYSDRTAQFSNTVSIRIPAVDGREMPSYLTMPKDADQEPMPLIIRLHGGPWGRYLPIFDRRTQLLANRGYAVLALNYRGSTGFGIDYQEAVLGRVFEGLIEDINAAIDHLTKHHRVDAERVALMGSSFGGYAALLGAFQEAGKVKAAISINGIADLPDFIHKMQSSQLGGFIWNKYLDLRGAHPTEEELRNKLASFSPAENIEKIRASVLLIVGMRDGRVSPAATQSFEKSLKSSGREVEALYFDDEGHTIRRRSNLVTMHDKILEFLEASL